MILCINDMIPLLICVLEWTWGVTLLVRTLLFTHFSFMWATMSKIQTKMKNLDSCGESLLSTASCHMFLIVDETIQLFLFHLVFFLYIKKINPSACWKSIPVLAVSHSHVSVHYYSQSYKETRLDIAAVGTWGGFWLWQTCQRISLHESWEPAYFKNNLVFNEREKSQKKNRNFSTYQQVCSLLHFQSICSPKDDSSTEYGKYLTAINLYSI